MLEDLKIPPKYDGFLYFAESTRNPPQLNSHHHMELEINLIVQGAVKYVANGVRYNFEQRSLVWFFPNQEHQLVHRTTDAKYYVVVFKPDLISRYRRSASYHGLKQKTLNSNVLHTILDPESFDLMKRTMDSLMKDALDADLLNREAGFGFCSNFVFQHGDPDGLNAGLQHLLLLGWRCRESGSALRKSVSLHPAVSKILDLLGRNPTESSLKVLAKQSGLSPSYLSRIFAEQIGLSLSNYRNTVRLAKFFEIMGGPIRPTFTEAVYEAGFGSYAQFYKVFRQTYGKGPREVYGADFTREVFSAADPHPAPRIK